MNIVTKNSRCSGMGSHKVQPMAKAETLQEMVMHQQIIKIVIQNGANLKELQEKHRSKFASLPGIKS